jgi:hypothetical protein
LSRIGAVLEWIKIQPRAQYFRQRFAVLIATTRLANQSIHVVCRVKVNKYVCLHFNVFFLLYVPVVISRSVVAHSASDSSAFHDRNFCTGTNLMILRAGIFPVVKNLYVDGQAVNFQYKDTVVKTSNVVIAAQVINKC